MGGGELRGVERREGGPMTTTAEMNDGRLAESLASTEALVPLCELDDHLPATVSPRAVDKGALQRAAAIFRALGDPARLHLLALLAAGEQCVSQLATETGDSLPAISQRLKLLRTERLVSQRRDGKHIYYQLADQHVVQLIEAGIDHAVERNSYC